MLVAAEASGDALGASLAQALKRRLGEGVRFIGVGGEKMAAQGVASPFDISELSILGLFEGVKAYPRVLRRVRDTAEVARADKPDVAVLIDSWGFTLRVAKALRRLYPDVPLIKYVGPQVWATRPGRARVLAGAVDHLLATQPMDPPFYAPHGLPVTFVGSPALARDFSNADPKRLRKAIGAGAKDQILLVLPGSRPAEIANVLPAFEEAVNLLKAERPKLQVVVPVAATVADAVRGRVAGWPHRAHIIEDDQLKDDAFVAADVALACSGTVTTELALAGTPVVVGYRIGKISHFLLKRLIRTPYITLFNIAAGRFVAPEFVQHECTGENLARAVAERLDDSSLRARQVAEQNAALELMGRGRRDPSEAAADAVLKVLGRA